MIIQIVLILLLLFVLYKVQLNKEGFIDTGPRHAKLNHFDGIEYVDRMSPLWRGEWPCTVYPCPAIFEDDVVCWKCHGIESEPQNE